MPSHRLTISGVPTIFTSAIPPRSRLFHLEPVGVGTPYVESLSGYAARLAEKHSTTLYYLFSVEVAPLISKPGTIGRRVSFANFAKAVNGMGVIAADLVDVLERLTLRDDLRFTTALPWAYTVSAKGLTRQARAWCPSCYHECAPDGAELYDQLLWALQSVTVCPKHKQRLEFLCPRCGREQHLLSHNIRPGFCSRCQSWLGSRMRNATQVRDLNRGNTIDGGLTRSEDVGRLLAVAPELTRSNMPARLIANLRGYVDKMFMGRGVRSQLRLPANVQTVRCWLDGAQTPSLPLLLETCSDLGISPVDLLRDESDRLVHSTNMGGGEGSMADSQVLLPSELGAEATTVDWKDAESVTRVERRLRAAMEDDPPASLTQVAKEFGCTRGTLRKKFSELAAQVAVKADAFYRPTVGGERMREVIVAALAETPPQSLEDISRRLGAGASTTTLRNKFPGESRKIVERYGAYKKRRLDDEELEKKLRAAMEKTPAPSMPEVSRQLGVARATLYSKFPELCNAISGRSADYRRDKSERGRAVAKAEVRSICERALREGVYPSFAMVRSRLSVPCQSETFSKIRREVLDEMES
jgi:DNA-binding Lrp family transcriptional regulator/ribosomal protein L37E